MRGSTPGIDACAATIFLAIRTLIGARTGGADLTHRALSGARATARRVARQVHALAVALGEGSFAADAARAVLANGRRTAEQAALAAGSAILRVLTEIDAHRAARGEALVAGEGAATVRASGFAVLGRGARRAAASAILRVGLEHDALPVAHRLAIAARVIGPEAQVRACLTDIAGDAMTIDVTGAAVQIGR